jgi:hypothetical protein
MALGNDPVMLFGGAMTGTQIVAPNMGGITQCSRR